MHVYCGKFEKYKKALRRSPLFLGVLGELWIPKLYGQCLPNG